MMLKGVIGLVFLCFLSLSAISQTTRDVAPTPPKPTYQSSKKVKKKKGFIQRVFNKQTEIKTGQEEVIEFRKKMAKNSKEKAKQEKKYATAQYQNPLYFGHKKPPKKRKNGKKKFCKECGLTH
ncbi:MAG: hypothetical protein JXR10_07840 [Cyclobacteriaceae bacterium]